MRLLGVNDRWLVTPSRSDPDVVIGRFGRPLVHRLRTTVYVFKAGPAIYGRAPIPG
jgi:hypothetical protein